jgi:peptide-methionine (S)-S-oxide reductase
MPSPSGCLGTRSCIRRLAIEQYSFVLRLISPLILPVKLLLTLLSLAALGVLPTAALSAEKKPMPDPTPAKPVQLEHITMGGGCFWCMEAVFQRLKGVTKVVSGFSGGSVPNPSYEAVCTGNTGHAEVVQIEFDPATLPLEKLLEVFWAAHDPTTLNRQGHDSGTQYRSVLYYENEQQKAVMEASKKAAQKDFQDPIVTEIAPFKAFYAADDHHQNYFNDNANRNSYCAIVIRPKLQKLLKSGIIKEENNIGAAK